MNKITLLIALIITTSILNAQHNKVENIFQKYTGAEGVTNLRISGSMIRTGISAPGMDHFINLEKWTL